MKNKRLYLVMIIAALAALFGGSGGVAWGQLIIDQNYSNVNNDFGAGESVTILGNRITVPTTPGDIAPGSTGKIMIGGPGAVNQVLRVYNGNGYGIGWVSVIRMPSRASGHTQGGYEYQLPNRYADLPEHPNGFDVRFATSVAAAAGYIPMPADYLGKGGGAFPPAGTEQKGTGAKYQNTIVMSFNSFNGDKFAGQWTGSNTAPCYEDLFGNSASNIQSDGSALVRVWHHGQDPMLVYQCNAISKPGQAYTTTQGAAFSHTPGGHGAMNFNQDEVHLTQFKGTPMQDASALANQKVPKSEPGKTSANDNATDWYIDNYTRPTTVAIQPGNTTLDLITIDTIGWRYEVNFVDVQEIEASEYASLQRHDAECNSGKFRAYAFRANWKPSVEAGKTHPDAAVQLLNGAQVCVKGSVQDITGKIGSKKALIQNPKKQTL